ncbi:helix-turn-helix domain-containing protein [Sphingomonas sp. ABOLF]|nr:helix-turn-helix domain-containing protein [Sphingomonas sp. ABOLF]RSV15661.1 helix-turn-helix domain-containing protein [Sphingomonas sp. ABOLF]
MSGILTPARRSLWSAEEQATMERLHAAGKSPAEIARILGRSEASVSFKTKPLRDAARPTPPEHPGITQWTCQNCNTRSTASLEIGCPSCLPLRREEARLMEAYERKLRDFAGERSMAA